MALPDREHRCDSSQGPDDHGTSWKIKECGEQNTQGIPCCSESQSQGESRTKGQRASREGRNDQAGKYQVHPDELDGRCDGQREQQVESVSPQSLVKAKLDHEYKGV